MYFFGFFQQYECNNYIGRWQQNFKEKWCAFGELFIACASMLIVGWVFSITVVKTSVPLTGNSRRQFLRLSPRRIIVLSAIYPLVKRFTGATPTCATEAIRRSQKIAALFSQNRYSYNCTVHRSIIATRETCTRYLSPISFR